MRNGGAHAVGVGVSGDDEARLDLLGEVEGKLQGLAELGIGIRAGGEVAVRIGLLGNHGHVVDADLLEDARDALHAGAVERRVDHGVGRIGLEAGDGDLLDVLDEGVKDGLGGPLDEALLQALVEVHHLDAVEDVDVGDVGRDLVRCLVSNLAAIVVVDLVTVVDRGVVGRRENDARGGVQVANRERERGNGLDARIDVDVNAVGGEDARGDLLEVLALVPRVTREGERGLVVMSVEIVGDALGGLGDDMDVHAVGADAEHAAQARSSERKVAIEGVVELLLVTGEQPVELCLEIGLGDVVLPELDLCLGG